MGFVRFILRWLALLGLTVKNDEPLEVREPDRQWGTPSGDLQLSAKAKGDRLSVVLKNAGFTEIRATIPEWLTFYHLDISGEPPLSKFGKHVLDPQRTARRTDVVLTPGKPIEAEIPISSLYEMGNKPRRVRVSCEVAGAKVVSNEVELG